MRGCSACLTASQQASTSPATARARPAMAVPRTSLAMAVTDSKSPGAGDLQLLVCAERDAGRLLAVAQGCIENQYLFFARHLLNLLVVCCSCRPSGLRARRRPPATSHRA